MHLPRVKHEAAEALSRLKIKGEDKKLLDDDVAVLTIPQEIAAFARRADITNLELLAKRESSIARFIPEFFRMSCIKDNKKVEIPTLAKLIKAEVSDAESLAPLTSVENPSNRFTFNSDIMLV